MSVSDEIKARSAEIAAKVKEDMIRVNARSAACTAGIRRLAEGVANSEKKVTSLVDTLVQGVGYIAAVEKNLKTLSENLTKAKTMKEEEAKKNIDGKKFGSLVHYSIYKSNAPAKPQLIKAIELGIAGETKRGETIVDENLKRANTWQTLAKEHGDTCTEVESSVGQAIQKMSS